MDKATKGGMVLLDLAAIAMLLYALLGDPPYSFFSILKLVVSAACGVTAAMLWRSSKWFLPLCVVLLALGWVELTGKMRRSDWVPYNWATVGALVVAGAATLATGSRTKDEEG